MRRLSGRTPVFAALVAVGKALSVFGVHFTPRMLADAIIRAAAGGDRFGLRRGGLTFRRLVRDHPHGSVIEPNLRTGILAEAISYPRGRIQLRHREIAEQVEMLADGGHTGDYPLRMIGMREPRSENSWMHNAPLLMRGDNGHRGLMNIDDAAERDIRDGGQVQVSSPYGRITVSVTVTKDIMPGVIAVPHGWGHKGTGGWRLANRAGGANVNQLTSSDPDDVETLSGMAWLTGVPVRVEAV